MPYTLSQIRLDGLIQSRSALDSTIFFNYDADKAFQRAAARMLRKTKQTRVLSQLQLVVGSSALPAFPTGFLPELVVDAYLTLAGTLIPPGVVITSVETVLQAQLAWWPWMWPGGWYPTVAPPSSPPTGRPTLFAFSSTTAGGCNTLCDQAYVLSVWWWQMLTSFRAGCMGAWSATTNYLPYDVVSSTGNLYQANAANINVAVTTTATWTNLGAGTVSDPTTLTTNIPDESLDIITQFGVPYYLQASMPEKAPNASAMLAQFDTEIARIASRDAGGRGEKTLIKASPVDGMGNWVTGRGCI